MNFYRFEFEAMTTPCEVQLFTDDFHRASSCFEEIKAYTKDLEKKYNFFDSKSYLNRVINNRKRNKVKVDEQTKNVLTVIKDLSNQTDGIFDISIGTIKKCFQEDSLEKIKKAKEKLKGKYGLDSWQINDNTLNFRFKETKLDLGGVIKEYAVDCAGNIVKAFGISSALINFGGDILAVGFKPDGKAFCVGIKNPKKKDENLLFVNIANQALTTSASYERNIKVEGEEISHIINKDKINHDIVSSTVITNSALKSGVFSTSLMINPSCNIYDDMQVVLIDKESRLHQNIV